MIETFGNGSEGKVMYYNDHKTRLYTGRVKVVDGKWNTTIFLPSEIENNYTAPLLTAYASSEDGREANGSFNRFYIYGFDTDATEDNDGPLISEFTINNPNFTDGSSVSPNTVIRASFSDPSGINISDGGIGHQLTLSLDNKTFFEDVNLYYTPDAEDFTAGTLSYPINGIPAGEHSLTLTVWDNANNSSSATLTFKVSADWSPCITSLYADASPAVSSVNFIVATDGTKGETRCAIDVLDLNGKIVWHGPVSRINDSSCSVKVPWNLCGDNGARVQRGIYLYRATVTGEDGYIVTRTRKLAVASE
ncbi:MAG: hypothetical protein K2K64_04825 [Muribaculaceae bacterium]|nr:hypothetical protein [Muribaculaceae bacterium]